jgi:hypothetical protein
MYYETFQGSLPEDKSPMLRLVIPINDIRGKHLMIKYTGDRVNYKGVDKFLTDFFAGRNKSEIDIKSEEPPKKIKKKYSSVEHLTGSDYFKRMRESQKEGRDSVVLFYRSNLKRDLNTLKKINAMAKKMKKLKDFDVNIFAYDVVGNAMMSFRDRKKMLPGLVLFKKNYDLSRNTMLAKANRHKEVMLFLNDRLTSDYSPFFIALNH